MESYCGTIQCQRGPKQEKTYQRYLRGCEICRFWTRVQCEDMMKKTEYHENIRKDHRWWRPDFRAMKDKDMSLRIRWGSQSTWYTPFPHREVRVLFQAMVSSFLNVKYCWVGRVVWRDPQLSLERLPGTRCVPSLPFLLGCTIWFHTRLLSLLFTGVCF